MSSLGESVANRVVHTAMAPINSTAGDTRYFEKIPMLGGRTNGKQETYFDLGSHLVYDYGPIRALWATRRVMAWTGVHIRWEGAAKSAAEFFILYRLGFSSALFSLKARKNDIRGAASCCRGDRRLVLADIVIEC